jgi:hypothetical protein
MDRKYFNLALFGIALDQNMPVFGSISANSIQTEKIWLRAMNKGLQIDFLILDQG